MSINDGDETHRPPGQLEDADTLEELQRAADSLRQRSKEAQLRRTSPEELGLALAKAINQKKKGLTSVLWSLPTRQDREDALQEVALRAFVSLKNGTIEPNVERIVPVLYEIAKNVRRDFFRKYIRRQTAWDVPIDLDDQSLDFAAPSPEGTEGIDDEMAFDSLIAAAKLGAKEERALRYTYRDDLTPSAMSERYGGSANAWSAALTAAKKKIHKNLTKEWHD